MSNLKQLLLQKKMRPEDLASKSNLGIATVYNVLAGRKRVKDSTLHKMAEVLGVPVNLLVPSKEEPAL
jgi:transcriptional regulator with XRE-family HTH domain